MKICFVPAFSGILMSRCKNNNFLLSIFIEVDIRRTYTCKIESAKANLVFILRSSCTAVTPVSMILHIT